MPRSLPSLWTDNTILVTNENNNTKDNEMMVAVSVVSLNVVERIHPTLPHVS